MRRKIVLVGHWPDYQGDGEIWGVNFAFQTSKVDKIFAMDPLDVLEAPNAEGNREDFTKKVNAGDFEIIMQKHYPEIPRSQKFNLKRLRRELGCLDYFTCTAAYMFAEAIRQKPDTILMHGIQMPLGMEFTHQKPCLDYWRGFAEGRGIHIQTSPGSILGRPYPWQSALYGYKEKHGEPEAVIVMAAASDTIHSGNHFRVAKKLKATGKINVGDYRND